MAATGWAVGSLDAPPVSGVFPRLQGTDSQKLGAFYDRLASLHQRYRFQILVHEFAPVISGHVTAMSENNRFALKAAVEVAGHILGFETMIVQPSVWRKTFLGLAHKPDYIDGENRAWLKLRAIQECERRGWAVKGDDEAEARGIMDYGLCMTSPAYAANMAGPLSRYAAGSQTNR